jgi:hypothetical protein
MEPVRTDTLEERQFLQEPHGVTSQKMPFLMVTAVKNSNLTKATLSVDIIRVQFNL